MNTQIPEHDPLPSCLDQSFTLFVNLVIQPEVPGAGLEVPAGSQGGIQHIVFFFHLSPPLPVYPNYSLGYEKMLGLLLGRYGIPIDPGSVSYFLTTAFQRATWPSWGQFKNQKTTKRAALLGLHSLLLSSVTPSSAQGLPLPTFLKQKCFRIRPFKNK